MVLLLSRSVTAGVANERVVIDMVQNNPGDAVAWQQSKCAAASHH